MSLSPAPSPLRRDGTARRTPNGGGMAEWHNAEMNLPNTKLLGYN